MIEQIPIIQQLINVNMLIVICDEFLIPNSSRGSSKLHYLLVIKVLIRLTTQKRRNIQIFHA